MPVKPLKEQWLLYQQSRWDEDKYDMLVQPADVVLEWDASETTASVLKGVMPDVWPVIAGVSVNSALKIDRSEDSRFMVGCAPPTHPHLLQSLLSAATSQFQQLLCSVNFAAALYASIVGQMALARSSCPLCACHSHRIHCNHRSHTTRPQRSLQAAHSAQATLHSSTISLRLCSTARALFWIQHSS